MIQTRFYGDKRVLAVVVRTGFATSKGGMVRSILFPRKLSIKFYADAMKFVVLLAALGNHSNLGHIPTTKPHDLTVLHLCVCLQLLWGSPIQLPSTFTTIMRYMYVCLFPAQLAPIPWQVEESVLRALDVITIVVPPALPAALTVGTVYALTRLRKNKIFCISPQR